MLKPVLLLPVLILATVAPAFAQAAGASTPGTITEAQAGVLPGVSVTVKNAESGVVRRSVTEGEGKYRLAGLSRARYNLTADLTGFQMVAVRDITLQIGQDYAKDFQLALSTLQESVTVTGESPIVEATKSEVATVVTQEQIATLPVQDRTALSLSLLLPGVGADTTRAKRNATNVGASVTTSATTYLVDGLSNSVNKSGEQRHDIPEAAIREFAVHTTQLPAQYGQRVGGVVNIVTKSGTKRPARRGVRVLPQPADEPQRHLHAAADRRRPRGPALQAEPVWLRRRRPHHQEQAALLRHLRADARARVLHRACAGAALSEPGWQLRGRVVHQHRVRPRRLPDELEAEPLLPLRQPAHRVLLQQLRRHLLVVQQPGQPDPARHARDWPHVGAVEPRAERVLLHARDRLRPQLPEQGLHAGGRAEKPGDDAGVARRGPVHRDRAVPLPERDLGQQPVPLAVPHRHDDDVHRGAGDAVDQLRLA